MAKLNQTFGKQHGQWKTSTKNSKGRWAWKLSVDVQRNQIYEISRPAHDTQEERGTCGYSWLNVLKSTKPLQTVNTSTTYKIENWPQLSNIQGYKNQPQFITSETKLILRTTHWASYGSHRIVWGDMQHHKDERTSQILPLSL